MPDLTRGDRVSHPIFGDGAVEAAHRDTATVRFATGKPRTILASHLERIEGSGLPSRAADADTLFDVYLMVDWSANSAPKTGADSVWYCLFEPTESRLFTANPATREQAFDEIRGLLVELVGRGRRTLVGFDFPYGFPLGTAARLGFAEEPAWRVMWDELGLLVEDGADNRNNRFVAAADVNGGMTTGPSPFWGCPPNHSNEFLHATKPRPWPKDIPEFRFADRAVAGPKSIWQLYGAGSVGSQSLLGIPRLAALRGDETLAAVSCVWPFESDGAAPAPAPAGTASVVHAEIYPSLVPPSPFEQTKDAGQVRALAEHFARLDGDGDLAGYFDLTALPAASRRAAVGEEGWILGVRAQPD
jgi:hypothetical protein